jgi:hypothetical protein
MTFSASTCLTYTGTTPLGNTIYVFSDADSFSSYFTTIPLSAITGNNCPYIITGIPIGATIIRLQDYATGCCADITIQCSDFCVTCDLNFTLLSASTVSQIVAGNLTGSCDTITDYVINWYGPNSTTEVGYVSGFGSEFDYQFPHPLTGSSAIFAQGGTYIPVIDKVIISGYTFSQTGGTGYIANLNCFDPISVESLKCNNGNSTGNFSHIYSYDGATSGELPQPLNATFELSANTKFFPYRFQGFSVPDSYSITLNSVNYPTPIKLESIDVGINGISNTNFTSFPRTARTTSFFGRVLTLTGFTISNGDYLEFQITPSTANTATNWVLGCKCKETFNCSSCLTDRFINNPYPIILSSVTAITATCDTISAQFNLSGCSFSESSGDTYDYIFSYSPSSASVPLSNSVFTYNSGSLYWSGVNCNSGGGLTNPICTTPNTNVITYEKKILGGIGDFTVTCSSFSDFSDFYNRYLSVYQSFSGTPSNPSSVEYYRAFTFFYPTPLGSNNCGDGTSFNSLNFHYSSVVTTGGTGPWFINFTMPTISAGMSFTSCEVGCQSSMTTAINNINNSSTGTSNNFSGTSNTGSRYTTTTVIQQTVVRMTYNSTPSTATTTTGSLFLYDYQYQTIPWSGDGNTLIPSLSGQTCQYSGFQRSGSVLFKYPYSYRIELTNPNDERDYDILGSPITNGVYSGFPSTIIYELAVRYSGGSVTYSNPYYTI